MAGPRVPPGRAGDLDAALARVQREGRVPALAACLVEAGRVAWAGGVGAADGGDAPAADTQFRIGSITKTVTAVALLRLRDAGSLTLADPLAAHLPGTPFGEVTLRALFGHTAGIAREPEGPWWEAAPGGSWAELAARLHAGSRVLPAGRHFHYSNLGYALLGEVLARRCGSSWYAAVRDLVLEPLGMGRTTYGPEAPVVAGYAVHPWQDTVRAEPAPDTGAMAPAGQLWSTTGDLARWVAFLAEPDPRVLAPASAAQLRAPGDGDYGAGTMTFRGTGRTLVGHAGSMPGYRAVAAVDRGSGVGGVVLANSYTAPPPQEVLATLLDTADGRRLAPPADRPWRPGQPPPPQTAEVLGPWFWGPLELRLEHRDGGLRLVAPARPAADARFEPAGPDVFRGVSGEHRGELLRVVRAEDGRVSHLDLTTYVLTREPLGER